MRAYNNSSSLSNFVLPQTTTRTNRSLNLFSCNNTLNGLSRRENAYQQESALSAKRVMTQRGDLINPNNSLPGIQKNEDSRDQIP